MKLRERSANFAPRIVFNATEGFGKTSLAAYAPSPLILMSRGEMGYQTLLDVGRVPQVPAEVVESWVDLLSWLDSLIADPQGVKTLTLDALNGFERMCHEHVCTTDFGGDFGEKGFGSFQKGFDLSVGEWLKMLARIEQVNVKHGVTILLLGHVGVTTFKNPAGADFDQYACSVHRKTWEPTAKWADAIFFGNFYSDVKTAKGGAEKKGKVTHTNTRIVYTERGGAVIAKNRYGLAGEIELSSDPAENWPAIWNPIAAARDAAQK